MVLISIRSLNHGGGPRGVLALHPAALVSILGIPKNVSLIVAKI